MSETFDLDSYFARIRYDGPRTPSLDTLRAIQLLHPQAIAFENLNPLLGMPVALDLESLQQKLIRSRRGGYCFEHNGVLLHALRALGFRVTGLAARVVWNQPNDMMPPRSHMVLRVVLEEGIYLADVGFGMSPTAPLRLEPEIEQQTPHEPFRLLQGDGHFTLQCKLKDEWTSFYRFDLQEQALIDYQVANYYVSTWPTSHFVQSLIAARATPEGRYGLRNNRLSLHRMGGESEQRILNSAEEVCAALHDVFGIVVPDERAFAAALARLNWPDFSAN
ncbi:arylamine N-acetyltransferase family protein [Dongia deserti]|uniref:arylamine N-acetyltransferase family protein n=1 Tax=Dongia deserti TaxID=2268030 RepID=UPI000E64E342|nr:arylamine N-acetyltransferase [Dongia deserti]